MNNDDLMERIADATQAIREHEGTIAILEQMIAANREGIRARAQSIAALRTVLAQRGDQD